MDQLAVLAEKLGITIEYLWPLLVQETIWRGVVEAAIGAALLVAATSVFIGGWIWRAWLEELIFPLYVVGVLFLGSGLGCLIEGVMRVLFPEAATIHKLFGG